MIILRYTTFENEKGILIENVVIPMDIPRESVYSINPMISNHGVCYKNVTVLETYNGQKYRVVGNWKDWVTRIRPTKNKIGFV